MNISKKEVDLIIEKAQDIFNYSQGLVRIEGERIGNFAKEILRILRKYKNMKEEMNMRVSKYVNLFEMARADLEGVVDIIKSGDFDKAASMYITKAKARGLDAKKVIIGLGSTFRNYEDISPDEIKQLKEKIKEKLGGELPAKKEKTKKSSTSEKKKEAAELAKSGRPKKTELIKHKEGSEKIPESTRVSKMRKLTVLDEIMYRSGMLPEGQYTLGDEGDQTSIIGEKKERSAKVKKGKKGTKFQSDHTKFGKHPVSGGNYPPGHENPNAVESRRGSRIPSGPDPRVTKAKGHASTKGGTENISGNIDREGIKGAWGMDDQPAQVTRGGKYTLD